MSIRLASALVLVAGFVVGACDAAPLGPAPRPAGEPLLTSTASTAPPLVGFTASGSIPIGSKGYTFIGIAPANGHVRVRTVGGVRFTLDPAYNEAPCGGIAVGSGCLWPQAPYGSGTAMGAGIGGGPLRVYLLVDGAEWAPRELAGGVLEWIVPVRAGARIEARRAGLDIFKQYCPYDPTLEDPTASCHPPHYAYNLEPVGLAGVYAEGVVPLRVSGPGSAADDTARVAPGKAATFTVEAVDGITGTQWYFLAWEGSVTMLGNCSGQMQCTVIPPTRGAVIVYGQWNGYVFGSEYLQIKATRAELQLECTPTVVKRGERLTCRAGASSGALTDIQWSFTDRDGNRIEGPGGPTSWAGTMVVGGTIHVSASLNGASHAKDALIEIEPRSWTSPVPRRHERFMRCASLSNVCFSLYPPTHDQHLGTKIFDRRGIALDTLAAHVAEGPNSGWSYLRGQSSPVAMQWHLILINDILNPANNDAVAQAWWAERPQCDRPTLLAWVRQHENLHADLFDANRHKWDNGLEALVAYMPLADFAERVGRDGEESQRIVDMIHFESGGKTHPNPPFGQEPCDMELVIDPTGQP